MIHHRPAARASLPAALHRGPRAHGLAAGRVQLKSAREGGGSGGEKKAAELVSGFCAKEFSPGGDSWGP